MNRQKLYIYIFCKIILDFNIKETKYIEFYLFRNHYFFIIISMRNYNNNI